LDEARAGLRADSSRWLHLGPDADTIDLQDWFIPQLYQVGADPVLLTGAKKKSKPAPAAASVKQALHGFPPPPMYRFHGRAMELLEIERAFRRYPAVLLSGMGGMGKTALAREAAAWWLRKGRFEAAIFCSFEQRAGAERVVQLIGQALEGEQFSARSEDEQWRVAVDLFQRRRLLLVWDNFESTLPVYQRGERSPVDSESAAGSHVLESPLVFSADARARLLQLYRQLTAGSPKGRLLVTCRPAETGLPGIKEFPLEGLARPDSLHLLAAVQDLKGISTKRPGYEREEIDKLLQVLDDHPLSIELVMPYLKTLTPAQIRAEFRQLLARFADETAYELRNRSLLASLEFSKKRLSESAQKVLPYLAWFESGVFELFLLEFMGLDPEAWASIRAELEATTLVSVEELPQFKTPFIRFHPTLPYAASPIDVPDSEAVEERFIATYLRVMAEADEALRGSQPAAGMMLMTGEEANLRAAMIRAFRRGDRQKGWRMAATLGVYFQMAGRLRERNALVEWVRTQLPEGGGLDEVTCHAILDHAWIRFTQGQAAEAIRMVRDLIARLEAEGLTSGEDPTSQLALSYLHLGRIHYFSGRPDLALELLQKAITAYEQLGDAQRGNLAAALGDLANAYEALGRFNEALEASERGLAINRELGRDREIATGLGLIAQILTEQQRYAEAAARYAEALRAAQAAGGSGIAGHHSPAPRQLAR